MSYDHLVFLYQCWALTYTGDQTFCTLAVSELFTRCSRSKGHLGSCPFFITQEEDGGFAISPEIGNDFPFFLFRIFRNTPITAGIGMHKTTKKPIG